MAATRFQQASPAVARIVLAAVVVAVLVLLAAVPAMQAAAPTSVPAEQGDLAMYGRVVERLRQGEPYHPALHAELVAGNYGTQSVFNWRPPAFLSALAALPSPAVAQAVLAALGAVALGLNVVLAYRGGGMTIAIAATFAMSASLISVLAAPAVLSFEVWTGVLILLSAGAYGLGFRPLGFFAAVAALLVRELAGIYVVACIVAAWRAGRKSEVLGWAVVLAGYAIYFVWHATASMALVLPTDPRYADSWLQFGGLGFIVATASFNGIFLLLPPWVVALVLPLGMLGLLAWPRPVSWRLLATVVGYLLLFAVFGRPANQYWGGIYMPLVLLGLAWSPAALADLVRAATSRV